MVCWMWSELFPTILFSVLYSNALKSMYPPPVITDPFYFYPKSVTLRGNKWGRKYQSEARNRVPRLFCNIADVLTCTGETFCWWRSKIPSLITRSFKLITWNLCVLKFLDQQYVVQCIHVWASRLITNEFRRKSHEKVSSVRQKLILFAFWMKRITQSLKFLHV